jgi:hypothetical protein
MRYDARLLAGIGFAILLLLMHPSPAVAFSSSLGTKEWGSTIDYSITGIEVDESTLHYGKMAHKMYSGKIAGNKITIKGQVWMSIGAGHVTYASAGFSVSGSGIAENGWSWPPKGQDGALVGGEVGQVVEQDFAFSVDIPETCDFAWIQGYVSRGGGIKETDDLYIDLNGKVTPKPELPEFAPPCKEAAAFYKPGELKGYYTGKPSLNYSRDQLVQQMVDALDRYSAKHKVLHGALSNDAVDIAHMFISSALPTGKEAALQLSAAAKAARAGKLTPGQLFETALETCDGNVRDALVTCHAALYRDGTKAEPGSNKAFIAANLAKLRNPEGYTDANFDYTIATGETRSINPRREIGAVDEQGVWYHFFGLAALEFTDENNITPFIAIESASQILLSKDMTEKVLKQGYPVTQIGSILSDYAIALEDSIRTSVSQRKPPDPDKYCINYAGVAAGRALRERLGNIQSLPKRPTFSSDPIEGGYSADTNGGTLRFESPLSLHVHGSSGQWFSFDQQTKVFDANTPYVIFVPFVETNGTWGLVVTPFFQVSAIELQATADAPITLGVYDKQAGTSRVFQTAVMAGQELKLAGFSATPALDGVKLAPAASTGGQPSTGNQVRGAVEQPPATAADAAWHVAEQLADVRVAGSDWQRYSCGEPILALPQGWYLASTDDPDFVTFYNAEQTVSLVVMHTSFGCEEFLRKSGAKEEWHQGANIGGRDATITQFTLDTGSIRAWNVAFDTPLRDGALLHLVFSARVNSWDAIAAEIESVTALVSFK